MWLFADVCNLISNTSLHLLVEDTQNCLSEMSNWCNTNHLVLNSDKTKIFNLFNCKTPNLPSDLYLNGVALAVQGSEEVKYLGLHIQEDLKWDSHINVISS